MRPSSDREVEYDAGSDRRVGPGVDGVSWFLQNCLGECRVMDHFDVYCRGLLSNLQRKSVEPIALAAGNTVRALQLFLTERDWDHLRLRDRLQQRVAAAWPGARDFARGRRSGRHRSDR